MKLSEIIKLRLANQLLTETKFKTVKDIASWMGAMQAQDYAMAKWAAGIRSSASTQKSIEDAINKGDIIRTHVLRPTWHFITSEDVYWMLELTAPRIKASRKSRDRELGLSEEIYKKSNNIIVNILSGNENLSRESFITDLTKAGIPTNENWLYHILMRAELDGLICSGVSEGNKQTYALLNERVPDKKILSRDESLAKLALKYFQSHAPATLQDFIWWSGLSARDASNALEMIKPGFISETFNSETFWLTNSFSIPPDNQHSIVLLPAFDEFIISYKSRSFLFPAEKPEHYSKAVSSNGVFRPVILIDGLAAGLWKRAIKKDNLYIEIKFFKPVGREIKELIEREIDVFGRFLDIRNDCIFIKYDML